MSYKLVTKSLIFKINKFVNYKLIFSPKINKLNNLNFK